MCTPALNVELIQGCVFIKAEVTPFFFGFSPTSTNRHINQHTDSDVIHFV